MNKQPMNKQHYPWWGYVRHIVREYPEYKETQELGNAGQQDEAAVEDAIVSTEKMTDGRIRLKLIRLMHWDKTHTLEGAAKAVNCDRSTAARKQRAFFEEVARNRGLMD